MTYILKKEFHMNLIERKHFYFDQNVDEVFCKGPSDTKTAAIQVLALRRTCDMPLLDPMITEKKSS